MNKIKKLDLGAISELKASSWLIEQGYEVYRNVSSTGNFDLVAIKGSELIKIDVTLSRSGLYVSRKKHEKAKLNGGDVLYVIDDGRFIFGKDHKPVLKLENKGIKIKRTDYYKIKRKSKKVNNGI